jgi:hypothetical protein
MPKFRKISAVVDATQWFKNGDHPLDYAEPTEGMVDGLLQNIAGAYRQERGWEGGIVRYYRSPNVSGESVCTHCGQTMHVHGWIDAFARSFTVCPGDWIVTYENVHFPLKPAEFARTYEPLP